MKGLKVLLAGTFLFCSAQAFAQSSTTTTIEEHSAPAQVIHETEIEQVPVPVPVPVEVPAPETHSSSSSSSSSTLIKKSEAPVKQTKQTTTRKVAYRAPRKHATCSKTTSSCATSKPATEVIEQHDSHTESHDSQ